MAKLDKTPLGAGSRNYGNRRLVKGMSLENLNKLQEIAKNTFGTTEVTFGQMEALMPGVVEALDDAETPVVTDEHLSFIERKANVINSIRHNGGEVFERRRTEGETEGETAN